MAIFKEKIIPTVILSCYKLFFAIRKCLDGNFNRFKVAIFKQKIIPTVILSCYKLLFAIRKCLYGNFNGFKVAIFKQKIIIFSSLVIFCDLKTTPMEILMAFLVEIIFRKFMLVILLCLKCLWKCLKLWKVQFFYSHVPQLLWCVCEWSGDGSGHTCFWFRLNLISGS